MSSRILIGYTGSPDSMMQIAVSMRISTPVRPIPIGRVKRVKKFSKMMRKFESLMMKKTSTYQQSNEQRSGPLGAKAYVFSLG